MALAAAVGACASAGGGAASARGAAQPTAREPGQPTVSTSMVLRGKFVPVLQSTGAIQAAVKIRVDGSVTLISTGVGNTQTRVQLEIGLPEGNVQLPWAIVPGACGNGAIAVMAVSKFGTIDVGSSGRGSIEADLAVALTPGARYHVEVYRSGQTLADVVACANLQRVE